MQESQNKINGPFKSFYSLVKTLKQSKTQSPILSSFDQLINYGLESTDDAILCVSKIPNKFRQSINCVVSSIHQVQKVSGSILQTLQNKLNSVIQKLDENNRHDDIRIAENKEPITQKVSKICQKSGKIVQLLGKRGTRKMRWYFQNPDVLVIDLKYIIRKAKISFYAITHVAQQLYIDSLEFMLKSIGIIVNRINDCFKLVVPNLKRLADFSELYHIVGITFRQTKQRLLEITIDPSKLKQMFIQLLCFLVQSLTKFYQTSVSFCHNCSSKLYKSTITNYKHHKQILQRKYNRQQKKNTNL